jgi:hypothetical protein
MRLGIRLLLLATSTLFLGLACGDEEETAAPAATQAVTAAATAKTEDPADSPSPLDRGDAGDPNPFLNFARLFPDALSARDTNFLLSRGLQVETVCRGDEQLGQCESQPPGTTFRGIPGAAWQSDAYQLFTPDEYRALLERYFGAAVSSGSDEFGGSSLRLYAIAAQPGPNGEYEYLAITTSIVDTYPPGGPIGRPEREAHVFRFRKVSGEWRFVGETVAVVTASARDWLSGECLQCYDSWQRWDD